MKGAGATALRPAPVRPARTVARTRFPGHNGAMRRRRLTAAALGVLAALILTEIGLRVRRHVGPAGEAAERAEVARSSSIWRACADPELVYTHRGGAGSQDGVIRIESHGILRPKEVAVDKPPGVQRVVVMGDSIAAAIALPHEERFATRIERRLTESGRAVEVLNFGVDGYDTLQEAVLLETVAARFGPDLVLVQWCMNDPGRTPTPWAWFREEEEPVLEIVGAVAGLLSPDPRHAAPAAGPVEEPGHWARMYARDSDGWRAVERGFDRIARAAADLGAPVVLVIFPLVDPRDPQSEATAAFRQQVAEAATGRRFKVVDLTPHFARGPLDTLQAAGWDVYHPSAAGHARAAEVLVPVVLDLLPRGR